MAQLCSSFNGVLGKCSGMTAHPLHPGGMFRSQLFFCFFGSFIPGIFRGYFTLQGPPTSVGFCFFAFAETLCLPSLERLSVFSRVSRRSLITCYSSLRRSFILAVSVNSLALGHLPVPLLSLLFAIARHRLFFAPRIFFFEIERTMIVRHILGMPEDSGIRGCFALLHGEFFACSLAHPFGSSRRQRFFDQALVGHLVDSPYFGLVLLP